MSVRTVPALLLTATLALAGCGPSVPEAVEEADGGRIEIRIESARPDPEPAVRPEPDRPRPAEAPAEAPAARLVEPVDVPAAIDRQDAAIRSGGGEGLLSELQAGLAASPGDADLLFLHGRLLGLLRHPAAARAEFEHALAIEPRHAWALHGLGVLDLREGDVEAAGSAFERAHGLDPGNPRFAVALAGLEYERARAGGPPDERRRRLARARDLLEAVQARDPDDARVEITFARVLAELGRPDEAIERAARAAERAPRDPAILLARAQLLESTDRLADAIAAYRQVLAIAGVSGEAEYARARLDRLEEIVTRGERERIAAASRSADLTAYLDSPDLTLRRDAYKRLRELGQTGNAPIFMRGLADPDRNVRIHSVWALGESGSTVAIPEILEVLRGDPDELARGAVGKALVDLGDPEAIEPLIEALAVEESEYVLDQIDFALRNLTGDDPLAGTPDARRRFDTAPESRRRIHAAWAQWWKRRRER